jgi:hypothetical protein
LSSGVYLVKVEICNHEKHVFKMAKKK